jgi:hypothetical protein
MGSGCRLARTGTTFNRRNNSVLFPTWRRLVARRHDGLSSGHPGSVAIQRNPVKKSTLILLFTLVCHRPGHAATPVENPEEPATPAAAQRQRDPTVGRDNAASTPSAPAQAGAINPANGQYYPPTGNGDVINPATGERYIGTPGGYINPNNGQFMPKIR